MSRKMTDSILPLVLREGREKSYGKQMCALKCSGAPQKAQGKPFWSFLQQTGVCPSEAFQRSLVLWGSALILFSGLVKSEWQWLKGKGKGWFCISVNVPFDTNAFLLLCPEEVPVFHPQCLASPLDLFVSSQGPRITCCAVKSIWHLDSKSEVSEWSPVQSVNVRISDLLLLKSH